MSDIVDRLRFLASGQDDPHSVAIAEAADALDAQAAEIEALKAANRDLIAHQQDLLAEVERLKADAARYRWLRDDPDGVHWIDARLLEYDTSDAIDSAIDAAMAQEPRG